MSSSDMFHTFHCLSSSAEDSESRHSAANGRDPSDSPGESSPAAVHSAHPPALPSAEDEDSNQHSKMNNQIGTVILYAVPIVSLMMDNKERLCLAQISSTLLKDYSYNEIHNRRVALGITCAQCTPVQLELLRRAGAMPVTSRRCGMITRREAERLCKSFLGDQSPPKLPENFAFDVSHQCAWGCRGAFLPSRYNSSRAKCIKCFLCNLFFSPNKFIFHSHRLPDSKYVQPDAANFNSWRRHIHLTGTPPDEVSFAWEDVKAMFNGGSRKRASSSTCSSSPMSAATSKPIPAAETSAAVEPSASCQPTPAQTTPAKPKSSHKKLKTEHRLASKPNDSADVPPHVATTPPSPKPTIQPLSNPSLFYRLNSMAGVPTGVKSTPAESALSDYHNLWNSSRFWAPYLNLNLNPLPVIPPYLYNYGYSLIKSDLPNPSAIPAAATAGWQYRHPRLHSIPALPVAVHPPSQDDNKSGRPEDDPDTFVDVETTDNQV